VKTRVLAIINRRENGVHRTGDFLPPRYFWENSQNSHKNPCPDYYYKEEERRVMQTTQTKKKSYSYPITNVGLDDDVAAVLKRLAKKRRLPTYRLASDVLRKWCERQERKEADER
jgi:hypothetical protein